MIKHLGLKQYSTPSVALAEITLGYVNLSSLLYPVKSDIVLGLSLYNCSAPGAGGITFF